MKTNWQQLRGDIKMTSKNERESALTAQLKTLNADIEEENRKRINDELGGTHHGCREYVDLFTRRHNVRVTLEGIVSADPGIGIWLPGNRPAKRGADVFAACYNYNKERELNYGTDNIKMNFDAWWNGEEYKRLKELDETINQTPIKEARNEWVGFISAITEKNKTTVEIVLKHWIWTIKRRLRDPTTSEHDLMVLLYGKTSGGKSVCVNKLLAPIASIGGVWKANFEEIEDIRCGAHFLTQPVAFLDEMEKAKKGDIDAIKNRITRYNADFRPMGTNKKEGGQQLTVFIGTTNKPLSALIHDDTGMRRFYQIECRDVLDWDIINNINYLDLWRSVDVDQAAPILPVLSVLRKKQEEYRYISTTEEFVLGLYETSGKDQQKKYKKGVGFAEMYQDYVGWEFAQKINHQWDKKSRNVFFNELAGLATIHKWCSVETKRRYKFFVMEPRPADVIDIFRDKKAGEFGEDEMSL